MKNWENFIKSNKTFIYIGIAFVCMGLGGLFSVKFLHQNLVIGIFIGAMAATLILVAMAPSIEHKFRKDSHGQQIKRSSSPLFKDLRAYLHPTRRHTTIGFLWCFFNIFFIVPLFGKQSENLSTVNSISILFLLFISLDGYQMVKRNVRISSKYGYLIHGAGSQYIGYLILFFCWTGCIVLILSMIIGW